ncbi:acyltransferase [Bradyrhizobium liaoningense]|uniref:acyltransferase family protein n=1 Tax=Bradyrhizobium liaoningense TaxID=43992 RepID=UPI001BABF970|nr:acyltransferase [Bradyrhizobium liaoningense]MBR0904592.1 acyltransferase [Bradyrhizobium liaoningense]
MNQIGLQGLEKKRQNSFDLVRLAAALCVLIAHQFSLAEQYLPHYHLSSLGTVGPKLADVGLYIFFALSGFLIFKSLEADGRVHRFLTARFLRIYPAAIVNTMVCILLGAIISTDVGYWRATETWQYLFHNSAILWTPTQFQLPGVLSNARYPSVNVPIWTLKYELSAYLALLAVNRIAQRGIAERLILIGAAAFFTAGVCYLRTYPPEGGDGLETLSSFNTVHLFRFFMLFFVGACYAAHELSGRQKTIGLLSVSLALIFAPTLAIGRTLALIVIAIAAIEVGRSSLLFSTRYARLGDLSYGTYLYAFPIQHYTIVNWLTDRNFYELLAADILLILICALLSWKIVEQPSLRQKIPRRNQEMDRLIEKGALIVRP